MPRQLRLRRRKEFDTVFRDGRARANKLIVLRTLPNRLQHNRYGFVTSKRLGNAVLRNRTRRRLREALRALPLVNGWDIVVSAKSAAAGASFQELRSALTDLLTRAGILDQQSPPQEVRP